MASQYTVEALAAELFRRPIAAVVLRALRLYQGDRAPDGETLTQLFDQERDRYKLNPINEGQFEGAISFLKEKQLIDIGSSDGSYSLTQRGVEMADTVWEVYFSHYRARRHWG